MSNRLFLQLKWQHGPNFKKSTTAKLEDAGAHDVSAGSRQSQQRFAALCRCSLAVSAEDDGLRGSPEPGGKRGKLERER